MSIAVTPGIDLTHLIGRKAYLEDVLHSGHDFWGLITLVEMPHDTYTAAPGVGFTSSTRQRGRALPLYQGDVIDLLVGDENW